MKPELWPCIETHGELEPAEFEWLHTNGAGAYAMSTAALMHTRRFHGMFVAALDPPLERYVLLSHAETTVTTRKRVYSLSTHRFPDVAPTPGYRLLSSFAQDPIPRWTFKLGKGLFERKLSLVRGKNVLVVRYVWGGKARAKLTVKPLLSMRPIHELQKEGEGFTQAVTLRPGKVIVQPVPELPPLVFGHSGMFMGSPDWWRRFEYSADRRRNVHHQEDLWTPGVFELLLEPNVPTYLVVGLGDIPETPPSELMAETERFLRALDPGKEHSLAVRALHVAAEQYRVPECSRPATIAGYPWLGVRTRDTLISLVGLYLVTGLVKDAKNVLATITSAQRGGLLLAGLPEASSPNEPASVDSSLWLFESVRELVKLTGPEDEFVQQKMLPVLIGIFDRVTRPTPTLVWLTPEGLLETGGDAEPLTWMDSFARGQLVTPRRGLAVELQALWSRGCDTLARLAEQQGNTQLAHRAKAARDATRSAFKKRFWCQETQYPYDHLDASAEPSATQAIRPNALIALSVDPEMFEAWQAQAIVEQARRRLLTPKGLRTLDPKHPHYIGYYEGGMEDRRAAYHQGVVWGYLLGAFARAALRLDPEDFELQMDLRETIVTAMNHGPTLGQIAQLASGDPPFVTGGAPAQAWSVAEFLRTLQRELGL